MAESSKSVSGLIPGNISTYLIGFIVFVLIYILLKWRKNRYHPLAKYPPGPPGYPIVGNSAIFKDGANLPGFLSDIGKKYGDIICLNMGIVFQPIVVLFGYDVNKQILLDHAAVSSGRMQAPDRKGLPGLLASNGERWKRLRQYATKGMSEIRSSDKVLDRIVKEANTLCTRMRKENGKAFDPYNLISDAATDVIITAVCGYRYDYDAPEYRRLREDNIRYQHVTHMLSFSRALAWLRHLPFKTAPRIRNEILVKRRELMSDLIEQRKLNLEGNDRDDLIGIGLRLAHETRDIKHHVADVLPVVVDAFVAGVMPIANVISFVIVFMLHFPEVQKRCHEEIDQIMKGREDEDVQFADKAKLIYVRAVLEEIVRLVGSPLNIPHMLTNDLQYRDYYLPKGTILISHLKSVHRDPKYWPDPDSFKPERWIDERGQLIKHVAYMPFSIGPRMCVGKILADASLFIFTSNMLKNFAFERVPGKDLPDLVGIFDGMGGTRPAFLEAIIRDRQKQ